MTTLGIKSAVALAGLIGLDLDPRDKGLIAGAALVVALAGDAIAAHFHIRSSKK